MPHLPTTPSPLVGLDLPVLRVRVTLRLLEDAPLPAYKGGMLRGGFGYAFQRTTCPQPCWGHSERCAVAALCPYRWVFETPHPPNVAHLHDLQDVPRPFVIEPPDYGRTQYRSGENLEFVLVLIGRGIDFLPSFVLGFEQLGRMGLGMRNAKARLERVEVLRQWQPVGEAIYHDGRVATQIGMQRDTAYRYDADVITTLAAALPSDLRLTLSTPLRLKTRGDFMRMVDLPALVQATCWRLNALATFHGGGPWTVDHRALVAEAAQIRVDHEQTQWVDWERTSTRGPEPRAMKLGGLIGAAVLRDVPPNVRAVLLAGSLIHIGKACVFGHGNIEIKSP